MKLTPKQADAVREALDLALLLIGDERATERYDRWAEGFYRETHHFAPGKSVPLEMCSNEPQTQEQENARREEWVAYVRRSVKADREKIEAGLAALERNPSTERTGS